MVNLIWLFLLMSGIFFAAVNGRIEVVTFAALNAAENAVQISFELIGIMALWLGIMKLAEEAGIVKIIALLVRPITGYLFPSVPRDHPAMGAIVLNLSANMLGLGNAATPFGLKAMGELQKLNPKKDEASEAMCTFLALNTSCITLIPATIVGIRTASGSIDPTAVVGTTLFATCCSTAAAVIADKIFRSCWERKRG
ncbi:MAG TPA: spore maturation protein [Peptococcaceae bacterium]|nr:MAG: Nucleoside recognition domain protein [Clostridia bacterium 41_269]HBT20495.1 spore maturation protein [Peptococcaceae bacterium]